LITNEHVSKSRRKSGLVTSAGLISAEVVKVDAANDLALPENVNYAVKSSHLINQTSSKSVSTAIREVHKGNTFFSPSIPSQLYKRNRKK
jgi:hypothetical protein